MPTRDEFPQEVKERLARRVGMRCSNPDCRKPTAGPDSIAGAVNLGEAAHITAAAPGGARYDETLTPDERRAFQNGVWLCRPCAKIVDNDELGHPVSLLREWKEVAEHMAALELRGFTVSRGRPFTKLEEMIPELVKEMRADLQRNPLFREFILMEKGWSYNAGHLDFLTYYYDDHEGLTSKITILENYGAIIDVTYNNTKRYNFTEEFVEYLLQN